jgi:hypothetical protein
MTRAEVKLQGLTEKMCRAVQREDVKVSAIAPPTDEPT